MATADSFWYNVASLCKFDGTGNSFVEEKTRTTGSPSLAAGGNATQLGAAYPKKFGVGSGYFDGASWVSGSGQNTVFPGDFTVEAWIRPSALSSAYNAIFDNSTAADTKGANAFMFYVKSDGRLAAWLGTTPDWIVSDVSTTVSLNAWSHVAVCRSGVNWYLFLNGSQIASRAETSATSLSNGTYFIGATPLAASKTNYFTGYIDSIRVTNAVARYTTNFAAPTEEFGVGAPSADPFWAQTTALLHFDSMSSGKFVDAKTGESWNNGDANVSLKTSGMQYGAGCAENLAPGTGATAYLYKTSPASNVDIPANTAFQIECYVNFSSTSSGGCVIWDRAGSGYILLSRAASSGNAAILVRSGSVPSGTNVVQFTGKATSYDVWYHYAIGRDAYGNWYAFIDGEQLTPSATYTGAFAGGNATIGSTSTLGSYKYLDEFRLTVGRIRYTAPFSVSGTYPLPDTGPYLTSRFFDQQWTLNTYVYTSRMLDQQWNLDAFPTYARKFDQQWALDAYNYTLHAIKFDQQWHTGLDIRDVTLDAYVGGVETNISVVRNPAVLNGFVGGVETSIFGGGVLNGRIGGVETDISITSVPAAFLNAYVGGVETDISVGVPNLATLASYVGGVDTAILGGATLAAYVGGVETAVSINANPTVALNAYIGGVETAIYGAAFLDAYIGGIETAITAAVGEWATLEAYIGGVETAIAVAQGISATLDAYVGGVTGAYSVAFLDAYIGGVTGADWASMSVPTATLAYATNLRTGETTRYPGYSFLHVGMADGRFVGIKTDGIYLLEGDDDDGTKFSCAVETHPADFDDMTRKRVPYLYAGIDAKCSATLLLGDDADALPAYGPYSSAQGRRRVQLPRGPVGRYAAIKIEGDAPDFKLDDLELLVEETTRKV